MPGVGLQTALAFEAFAPDMSCFERGRDLAAWLGLVPMQHSTGGKGCDSHMGSFFIWHILSPIETFAKVEAMSESRSIEDLPIVICCSFEWIPVFS